MLVLDVRAKDSRVHVVDRAAFVAALRKACDPSADAAQTLALLQDDPSEVLGAAARWLVWFDEAGAMHSLVMLLDSPEGRALEEIARRSSTGDGAEDN
jgi:hypothetical protein